ncbi:hypothetical protein Poli38472_011707 [Pythium oligandrum]|uniref:C2 domain-containing protein n=1 Tax=Pythium oligandrum TaxID=41045 RepID=A0A8K1C7L4_PYTOL|nr:hypothetical protein Poli38472_011707 [Pythium oligandrum]|eukprot:TMW58119.1 hypothetical protein Poli38472_011707 [Pythium oligandrum]
MRIVRVEGLPNVRRLGVQSPYCKWRLVGSDQREVASSRTMPGIKGGVSPQWETQSFWIVLSGCGGVSALNGLTLYFVVKTAGMLPKTSITIAEGSYRLHDVFKSDVGTDGKWEDMNLGLTAKEVHAGVLHFKMQHRHEQQLPPRKKLIHG